ncbi:hypothetical protein [Polymorphospora lycopeni]|uniref:DUF2304 domain-containing protein n=1 Tax=Polymorphospora lycopeni TaxID=3140240 RepID=A0ABV5CKX8_9ACTN
MLTYYQAAVLVLLLIGLVAAGLFLGTHRPRRWRRLAAWDASAWVLIVFLFYLRQVILIILRWPGTATPGVSDAIVSIGFLVLLDAALILRIASYRGFVERAQALERSVEPGPK